MWKLSSKCYLPSLVRQQSLQYRWDVVLHFTCREMTSFWPQAKTIAQLITIGKQVNALVACIDLALGRRTLILDHPQFPLSIPSTKPVLDHSLKLWVWHYKTDLFQISIVHSQIIDFSKSVLPKNRRLVKSPRQPVDVPGWWSLPGKVWTGNIQARNSTAFNSVPTLQIKACQFNYRNPFLYQIPRPSLGIVWSHTQGATVFN